LAIPINASSATLILAYGSYAGQYKLYVNGGTMTVRGAVRRAVAFVRSVVARTRNTGLARTAGSLVPADLEQT
jgi:hypothetical protein